MSGRAMGKQQEVELAVEITDDLYADLQRLADQRFGNPSDEAVGRIVEESLDQWAELRGPGEEVSEGTEEPVGVWGQNAEITVIETEDLVRAWLFRRGP